MGASASGEATSHEVDDDMCVMKPNEAEHLAAGDGVPVSRGVTILFLKKILANEKSVRAAFEPVALSAGCSNSGVERLPFLRALTRVSMHFNPAENVLLPISTEGPPYSKEEAYQYFCAALYLLTEKLENTSEHDRLSCQLKASHIRVKTLQLALECEEASIQEQSRCIASLSNMLHEMDEQDNRVCKPVMRSVKETLPGEQHGVMTLEDLKIHVRIAKSLRKRIAEIEKTLDEREDRVMSLLMEKKNRNM